MRRRVTNENSSSRSGTTSMRFQATRGRLNTTWSAATMRRKIAGTSRQRPETVSSA